MHEFLSTYSLHIICILVDVYLTFIYVRFYISKHFKAKGCKILSSKATIKSQVIISSASILFYFIFFFISETEITSVFDLPIYGNKHLVIEIGLRVIAPLATVFSITLNSIFAFPGRVVSSDGNPINTAIFNEVQELMQSRREDMVRLFFSKYKDNFALVVKKIKQYHFKKRISNEFVNNMNDKNYLDQNFVDTEYLLIIFMDTYSIEDLKNTFPKLKES